MPVTLPPPTEFGAPAKFSAWRTEQVDAVLRIAETDKRFLCLNKPTGAGKSLTAAMAGKMTGKRTLILTATKALQTHYRDTGLTDQDIRGQQNHECLAVRHYGPLQEFGVRGRKTMVDRGPCHVGVQCPMKFNGCTYFSDIRYAREQNTVTTNYDYWLAVGKSIRAGTGDETLGQFDLLILDEAHAAVNKTCSALRIEFLADDLSNLLNAYPLAPSASIAKWRRWAEVVYVQWECQMERMTSMLAGAYIDESVIDDYKNMKRLGGSLIQLRDLEGDWLTGHTHYKNKTYFDPVWPTAYTEELLFRSIPQVVLLSATVIPKTLDVLGAPPEDREYIEYASTFPVRRRPVYAVSSGPRVSHNMSSEDEYELISMIDAILRTRFHAGRKGLIHCVSYKRMQRIKQLSTFTDSILIHDDGKGTQDAINKFKLSTKPVALLSPSITTGEDFPNDLCRFIIIPKLPFLDSTDPITQRRESTDPEYGGYSMIQTLVQSTGRGVRHDKDWCEAIILDAHFLWAWKKYKHHAPKWWRDSVMWKNSIPPILDIE